MIVLNVKCVLEETVSDTEKQMPQPSQNAALISSQMNSRSGAIRRKANEKTHENIERQTFHRILDRSHWFYMSNFTQYHLLTI